MVFPWHLSVEPPAREHPTSAYQDGTHLMAKHIFVTGGVVSSLGKGLTSASIGMLLEQRGPAVRMQKLDPYINVDPGTMSPYQHGEVYVLDDGAKRISIWAITSDSPTAR